MRALPKYVDTDDNTQTRHIQKVVSFKCCPNGNMKCLATHKEKFEGNDPDRTRVNSPEVATVQVDQLEPILSGKSLEQQEQTKMVDEIFNGLIAEEIRPLVQAQLGNIPEKNNRFR